MHHRILLAIDGSRPSDLAVDEAAKLGGEGVQLKVITVADNPYLLLANPYGIYCNVETMREAIIEKCHHALQKAQRKLASLGVRAELHLVDLAETANFSIAEAILNYADTWQADLIVLGTHGRKGITRFFMGSVAECVARTSIRPVLLVRDRAATLVRQDDVPVACNREHGSSHSLLL